MVVPLPAPVGLVRLEIFFPNLTLFCFVSMANGINITNGLDGLATGAAALALSECLLWFFQYVLVSSLSSILCSHTNTLAGMKVGYLFLCDSIFTFQCQNQIYCDVQIVLWLHRALSFCYQFQILLYLKRQSMAGACVDFLMYNRYNASIYMGDTGALALGGALAAMTSCTGMFFPLFLSLGVFVVEAVSVIAQVSFFKVIIFFGRTGGYCLVWHHSIVTSSYLELKNQQ